jgi:hypothetical protein
MQLMLGIYEFPDNANPEPGARGYPKQLVVEHIQGYRAADPLPG